MNGHLTRSVVMSKGKIIYRPGKATKALLKPLLIKGEVK